MKTYLDNIFNDSNVEDALAEYIFYHNNKKQVVLNLVLMIKEIYQTLI